MTYDEISSQDTPRCGSYGWIQWKGTDVCMDVHCTCGYMGHIDADFFYYYECAGCGKKYAVGQVVRMILLTEEQIKEVGGSFYIDRGDE